MKAIRILALILALVLSLSVLCSCDDEPEAVEPAEPSTPPAAESGNGPFDLKGVIYESDDNTDDSDNEILAGVACKLTHGTKEYTCTSDEEGKYSFKAIPKGTVTLEFSIDGYVTGTKTMDLTADKTMAVVLDKVTSNTLKGTLLIADADTNFGNNYKLPNATVRLERTSSLNAWSAETTTDSNGFYSFGELTAGVYKLTITCEGYISIEQIVTVKYDQTIVQNVAIEAIEYTGTSGGSVPNGIASGIIVDSRTGHVVAGLKVLIRAGLNNTTGPVIATVYTNASGVYTTGDLAPGNYTAQLVDERELQDEEERFGTLTIAIKILPNVTIENQNGAVTNTAGLNVDSMRIVLRWGSSPSDLDSHLQANLTGGGNYHVYYSNKNPNSNASLDLDDTSSYGPETVTVTVEDGVYTYYVHNYSGGSSGLAGSGATVEVYVGLATVAEYTFYVPSGSGIYWTVFSYNSTTQTFTTINQISSSPIL